MGLGKTASVLQALSILQITDPGPVLILGPLRVARNVWSDEIEKWSDFNHFKISKILGNPSERKEALNRWGAHVTQIVEAFKTEAA